MQTMGEGKFGHVVIIHWLVFRAVGVGIYTVSVKVSGKTVPEG